MDKVIAFFLGWALVVACETMARADIALVRLADCAILQVYLLATPFVPYVNIPGSWQAFHVPIGWTSPDGLYKIELVAPFVPASAVQGARTQFYGSNGKCVGTVMAPDPAFVNNGASLPDLIIINGVPQPISAVP